MGKINYDESAKTGILLHSFSHNRAFQNFHIYRFGYFFNKFAAIITIRDFLVTIFQIKFGGPYRIRTGDLCNANAAL